MTSGRQSEEIECLHCGTIISAVHASIALLQNSNCFHFIKRQAPAQWQQEVNFVRVRFYEYM